VDVTPQVTSLLQLNKGEKPEEYSNMSDEDLALKCLKTKHRTRINLSWFVKRNNSLPKSMNEMMNELIHTTM
jgi:hypothetical protein